MYRDDTGMVERGNGFRFALEACAPLGIGRRGSWEDLDGDLAAQARVASPVHLAHATDADGGENLVGAESDTSRQGHLHPSMGIVPPAQS